MATMQGGGGGNPFIPFSNQVARPINPWQVPIPWVQPVPKSVGSSAKNTRTGKSAPAIGGSYKGYPYSTGSPYGVTSANAAPYQSALDQISAGIASSSVNSAIPDLQYDPFVDPYAKFDPEAMAAREFNPQYTLLDQMAQQATARNKAGSADISNAWNLLAKDVAGKAAGISSAYDTQAKASDTGYANVKSGTDKEYEAAKAEILANAQRTGTMETVGNILANLAASRSDLNAQTGARKQNAASFSSQMKQNALETNRLSSEGAQWGGINAKADFAARLEAALGDIANKRLETRAAQGAAANKYGLDIAGLREQARNAWDTLQTSRMGQAIDIGKMQQQAAADAADAAKANAPKDIDTTKLTPTEYLAYLAKIQYGRPGEGPGRQQNAVQAIQDVFMGGSPSRRTSWHNVSEFVADVLANNPNASHAGGDAQQLAQMAQDYYVRIAGGANKSYGTNKQS